MLKEKLIYFRKLYTKDIFKITSLFLSVLTSLDAWSIILVSSFFTTNKTQIYMMLFVIQKQGGKCQNLRKIWQRPIAPQRNSVLAFPMEMMFFNIKMANSTLVRLSRYE